MMQFYLGGILVVGITKGNVEKLQEGKPIYFEVKGKEPIKNIAIFYGENKMNILNELAKSLNMHIPDWMRKEAENDPS